MKLTRLVGTNFQFPISHMETKKASLLISENDLSPFVQPRYVSAGLRFLVYFLAISFVPLMVASFSLIQRSQFTLTQEIERHLQTIASLKIAELNQWQQENKNNFLSFTKINKALLPLAEELTKTPDTNLRDQLRMEMNEIREIYPQFLDLFLMDMNGRVVLSTDPLDEGGDHADHEHFQKGKKDYFPGKLYFDNSRKENAFTLSTPLEGKEKNILFVVGGSINPQRLYELLRKDTGLGQTGETYLVTRSYKSIPPVAFDAGAVRPPDAGNKELVIGVQERPIYTQGVIRAFQGAKAIAIYKNYRGEEVIGYFEYLPEYEVVFLAEQATNEAFLPISEMKFTLLWIFIVIFSLDTILAFIIGHTITEPIYALTANAQKIQSGDYRALNSLSAQDEFGLLSSAMSQMAESLIISLEETKNIINTMPSALFILDLQGIIQSANQVANDLIGISGEQLRGKALKSFLRYPNIHDKNPISFELNELKQNKSVASLQLECFTRSHHHIPVSLSGSILTGRFGQLIGYIIILQDLRKLKEYAKQRLQKITPILQQISLGDFSQKFPIPETEDEFTDLLIALDLMLDNLRELIADNQRKTSEIKESQLKTEEEKARAESFLRSIGEGILAIDLRGKIISMNPAAEKLFQRKISDIFGKDYMTELHFENEKGEKIRIDSYPIRDVAALKKQIYAITYFMRSDGSRLPLATTCSPILFEDKLLGIIGTFRDITKEMEVDRSKSEFVSLASHQLRTPLTGLKWLLEEVVRKNRLDDMQTEYLQDALRSNNRMIRLVSALLNVSRLETGIISVSSREINLYEFLEELIKEAVPVGKAKNISIKMLPSDPSLLVSLDKNLIGQVVNNLISNAITYSDPERDVYLSFEKKNDSVEMAVRDQGVGISEDDQEKLFTKFFRASSAHQYSTTGSGLGLYIIKKILEVCNGSIRCESKPGQGAVFTITLPLKGPITKTEGGKSLIEQKFSEL